jgi:hypothetical protein
MPQTQYFKVTKDLEAWLPEMQKRHPDAFPHAGDGAYAERYTTLAAYLNSHVHSEVERGALLAELLRQLETGSVSYDNAMYLNNHGPEHVKTVIARASDLLRELPVVLSPYEGYLLLTAIHFHDVGNVFGREQHEKRCAEIMNASEISGKLGDATERRVIARIASAHGGLTDGGNKDTISQLQSEDERYGQEIRPRFLAAILRFADELADDRARASRFLLQEGTLPSGSELFHAYSFSLQSILVKGSEVRLSYEIPPDVASRKYKRPDGKPDVYLLDEIYARVRKMHRERMYCMRFWPPNERRTVRIRGRVEAMRAPGDAPTVPEGSSLTFEERNITFGMEEEGYPGSYPNDTCGLCLGTKQDLPDGEQLRKWVEHTDEDGDK